MGFSIMPRLGVWGVWYLEQHPMEGSSPGRGMGQGVLGWGGGRAWLIHSGSVAEMLDLGKRVTWEE